MNFDLGPDERALQEGIRDLCRKRFPLERIRTLENGTGLDRGEWAELGRAGVFSLRVPETKGGLGLGITEAVLVYEELGRALVPGPLIASHLGADLIEGAATGERMAGFMASQTGNVSLVAYLESLDDLLVADHEGVWRIDPAEVDATPVTSLLDPLTPTHVVTKAPRGERLARHPVAARWWLAGSALAAAQLVGIALAVTDMAVEYAKGREQFGRPIGSFQAVKHLLADMLVRAEVARAAVHAAACTLDDSGSAEARRAVAGAKLLAGEAAVANGKAAIQVQGGMGFTWEADVHLYLKRAAGLSTLFGQADELAEAMAAFL
jgi:alkylation response protein AidB-like acyl-CoA dehydrogenase